MMKCPVSQQHVGAAACDQSGLDKQPLTSCADMDVQEKLFVHIIRGLCVCQCGDSVGLSKKMLMMILLLPVVKMMKMGWGFRPGSAGVMTAATAG